MGHFGAQGNGRVTCPQHTHLVESEPIIPVPGADGYDDDSGGGGGPGGNDDDDLSDDLPDDVSADMILTPSPKPCPLALA